MHEFFDDFQYVNGQYKCNVQKRVAMMSGKILVDGPHLLKFTSQILQGHPINNLIEELLLWFKARYQVAETADVIESSRLLIPGDSAQGEEEEDIFMAGLRDQGVPSPDVTNAPEPSERSELRDIEKDKAVAANLQDHTAMATLLRRLFHQTGWPLGDKVPDQLQRNYNYVKEEAFGLTTSLKRTADESFGTTASSFKRPRTSCRDENDVICDGDEERLISSLAASDDPFLRR
ncbi:uncharacterized protein FIBRA_09248 [Fibroporia radiculosa]|uniref:Uncharacterized protein n=1 Tax=Fibroporia radiculosa TaxID=599839 RepID=J7S665_9APHY|nr:uncharacterized protein FIBRA_09248 [Fibroporia radiculosa]CCM06934.1 predicted protein [Fibroporia radiculosa]